MPANFGPGASPGFGMAREFSGILRLSQITLLMAPSPLLGSDATSFSTTWLVGQGRRCSDRGKREFTGLQIRPDLPKLLHSQRIGIEGGTQ